MVGPALRIPSAGSPKMCIFTNTHISGFISNLSRREREKKLPKSDYSEVIMSLFGLNLPLGKIFK